MCADASTIALPDSQSYLYRPGFVGRHDTLERLESVLRLAQEGRGIQERRRERHDRAGDVHVGRRDLHAAVDPEIR